MGEWTDALGSAARVGVSYQLKGDFLGDAIAERDHFAKLPAGIDMQQRKGNRPWVKRLLRQTQHNGRILADGVKHHRPRRRRRHLAEDFDRLGFKI